MTGLIFGAAVAMLCYAMLRSVGRSIIDMLLRMFPNYGGKPTWENEQHRQAEVRRKAKSIWTLNKNL